MPEVKEIVVVCDPSYQDIFEGMQMHIISLGFIDSLFRVVGANNIFIRPFLRCKGEDTGRHEICFAWKGETRLSL